MTKEERTMLIAIDFVLGLALVRMGLGFVVEAFNAIVNASARKEE